MPNDELDKIEIKIVADTKDAKDGVKDLVSTLEKIKEAANGSKSSSSTRTANAIEKIKEAVNGINDGSSGKILAIARAVEKLNGQKVSANIATQITKIGSALNAIDFGDIAKLGILATNIDKIAESGGIGNIKVSLPKTRTIKKEIIKPEVDTKEVEKGTDDVTGFGNVLEDVAKKAQSEEIKPRVDMSSLSQGAVITNGRAQFEELGQAMESNFDFGSKLPSVFSEIGSAAASAGSEAMAVFSTISPYISAAIPIIKKLASAFWSVAKTVAKIGVEIGKITVKSLTAPFVALGKAISGVTGKIKGLVKSIGRIAFYRAIRSAIKAVTQGLKEGVNNAYEFSKITGGQLAKSLNSIATSSQYLKNSLGAMAAPLLNALAPAIDYIADKLVALINLFNQVFAKFTGATTWMKAKKQAVEYSGAANDATAATKKFKATILGIDEINPLTDNSAGGGGSGGGGADYGSMFEEVAVDSSIADFVQDIKDRIDAGDWEGVGSLISDKLVLAMDQIDWNTIYAKADNFGTDFASFLNGLFETKVDPKTGVEKNVFTAVGETIAGALNTAIHTIDKFGETFDFEEFGSGVALGITRFLNTFDWKTALSAAENWGAGVAKAINGFINKKDKDGNGVFSSVGTTVANGINTGLAYLKTFVPTIDATAIGDGIATSVIKAIQGIKWSDAISTAGDIGKKIAQALNGFINAKDKDGNTAFSSLGQAVANLLVAAINGWYKFVTTFNFDKLGEKIASAISTFFKTMNENDGWNKAFKAASLTMDGIVTGISSAIKSLDKEEINKFLGTALMNLVKIGWNGAIDLLAAGSPLPKSFWNMFKVQVKDDTDDSDSAGKALSKAITSGLSSEGAKEEQLKGGKTVGKKVGEGVRSADFSGITKSITGGITSEDAKSKYKSAGQTTGKNVASGAKGYSFVGIAKSIFNALTGKDSKDQYKSAGQAAATSFEGGFKSKTITVSIQGKLTTIKAPKELNTVDLAKKGVRVEYTFAGGGFPQSGQMFIANENGIPPEYVGSFGNHTAVANTDQIVEGISSGVYAANQEQNALLRQQNALLAQQNELLAQQSGGGQVTVSSIVTGVDRYNRRAGKTVMATA